MSRRRNFSILAGHAATALIFTTLAWALPVSPAQTSQKGQGEPRVNETAKKQEQKATVYIYRQRRWEGILISKWKPSVYCDQTQLARMENGRFFVVRIGPGKHIFRSTDKRSGIELDVKSGEQYYIRVEMNQSQGRLSLVLKEQGAYEIKQLAPLGANNIKDSSIVVADEAPQ